ncbi:hypothetical protein TNCV_381571 [Trichonephila clavipes]|nr:hypothetical protein TNCV_381571 [Trichonephila clavipes]
MRPLRKSHRVLAKYRRERPKVYNSAGLGASLDDDWVELRQMLTDVEKLLHLLFQPYLEQITDDFINLVRIKLDENNEINILQYLYRWALERPEFESQERHGCWQMFSAYGHRRPLNMRRAESNFERLGREEGPLTIPENTLRTATAGSDVVQSGRPIFDDFSQHLWPYIGNNTANVVFQMVKRLWLIRIDQ